HACRQSVSDYGAVGHNRHAARQARRFAGGGIENVMIPATIFHEEALVVAGCAERAVREIELGEAVIRRTSGILDAEAPRPSVLESGNVDVAAGLNHEV